MIYKYFLPAFTLSFHYLNSIFCQAKLLILINPNLSVFLSFIDHVFSVNSKNSLLNSRSQSFSPKNFIILCVTHIFNSS